MFPFPPLQHRATFKFEPTDEDKRKVRFDVCVCGVCLFLLDGLCSGLVFI